MLVAPFVALCATPLSDYSADKLVDLWDAAKDAPREIDYTLFEATVGGLSKEHGILPSACVRMPPGTPEIKALALDMRYSGAARWLEREQEKAANIMAERNSGNTPGKASNPRVRKMAGGGTENYMKHKKERVSRGRRTSNQSHPQR